MNKEQFQKVDLTHDVLKLEKAPGTEHAPQARTQSRAPMNWSRYEPTGNHAIDLCAQVIGWAKRREQAGGPKLLRLSLRPMSYRLFLAGLEVLQKKKIDPQTRLQWDGVPIIEGPAKQMESVIMSWYGNRKG